MKSATNEIGLARARAEIVENARATCHSPWPEVVLADEPGLERMLNGRIVATPFQTTHLARRGKFDADVWIADVERPEVTCLVMQDDLLERPIAEVSVPHDRFGARMRGVLRSRFRLVGEGGGYRIYQARVTEEKP